MIILETKKNMVNIYHTKKNTNITYIKPDFTGYFDLIKQNNKIYINEIKIIKSGKTAILSTKELMEILKKQQVILYNANKQLLQLLNQYEINYKEKELCDLCLSRRQITILNKTYTNKLTDSLYCKNCAENYLKSKNLFEHNKYLEIKLNGLLNKYTEINDIINIIQEKEDPTDNSLFTLYDTLEVTQDDYKQVNLNALNISDNFRNILKNRITNLLPVQVLALDNGLLNDENLLVISATASGKTLIGELAGIPKALEHKKMIYLSPLVALANQKYRDFKRDYEPLGLKIAISVGKNRVKDPEELQIVEEPIEEADIIVATYEGLDYILRSGKYSKLNTLGIVIIDEIHMLENEDRGHRLFGLINRLEAIYPHSQILGLSATIKNSKNIAKMFDMKLVEYDKRPIKIERHLLPVTNRTKYDTITKLCVNEFKNVSTKGYKGQTIIFTDSRRKTQILADMLKQNNISAEYYHAGLTYNEKLNVEERFLNQEISTVVTTSALANGIDFPASQVIFESLKMGIEFLTNNEFHQMLGRAGRPSYHDIGKVYLIPVIDSNNIYDSEYMISTFLLNEGVSNIRPLFDENDVYEEVLSDICAIDNVDIESLSENYLSDFIPIPFNEALYKLTDLNMLDYNDELDKYRPTLYGRAVSQSFINIETADKIKNNLYMDIIDLILEIELLHNAYISPILIRKLNNLDVRIGTNLFNEKTIGVLNYIEYFDELGNTLQNKILNLHQEFMHCTCNNYHNCNCFQKNISQHIIERRLQGWTPREISKEFKREYEVIIYQGDIYSYLDQVIRILESIKRIANVFGIESTVKKSKKLIKKIEDGY